MLTSNGSKNEENFVLPLKQDYQLEMTQSTTHDYTIRGEGNSANSQTCAHAWKSFFLCSKKEEMTFWGVLDLDITNVLFASTLIVIMWLGVVITQ